MIYNLDTRNPRPAMDPAGDMAGNRFGRWLRAGIGRWQRDRMSAMFHRLDDRMLDDIGLHRADISLLVQGLMLRERRAACPAAPVASIAPAAVEAAGSAGPEEVRRAA